LRTASGAARIERRRRNKLFPISGALTALTAILACPGAAGCKRPFGAIGRHDVGAGDAAACFQKAPTPAMSKPVMARALLDGSAIYVYLDSRRKNVVVPAEHQGENMLVLEIGYHLALPIPDLEISEDGFSGTLSFHHQPFFCRVPWSAVYGIFDEERRRGGVWYSRVPQELRCAE
jgi:hypothetical protein